MGVCAVAVINAVTLSNVRETSLRSLSSTHFGYRKRSYTWSRVCHFLWPFIIVICGVRAIFMIWELHRGYVSSCSPQSPHHEPDPIGSCLLTRSPLLFSTGKATLFGNVKTVVNYGESLRRPGMVTVPRCREESVPLAGRISSPHSLSACSSI